MISRILEWLCPDWLSEPDEDDDETSAMGFNEPTSYEPDDEDED